MATGESNVVADCLIRGSRLGCLLGKNVRGMFQTIGKRQHKMKAGWLIPASPDLLGHYSLIITPEMVGKKVAVAMYVEVKTETGYVAKEQQHFIDHATEAGAIAGVARSADDLENILKNYVASLSRLCYKVDMEAI